MKKVTFKSPLAIFQDTQLLPRNYSPLFPTYFIFSKYILIHSFPLKRMGLHTRIVSCTVDSVVKGIETILSKIALSVSRHYCYKRKLEHMDWAESDTNGVYKSALVI